MFVATNNGNESQPTMNTIYTSSAIYNAFPKQQWSQPCRPFEFHELLSATDNFNMSLLIGRGGFGKVYKGNLVIGSTSVVVAIKRFHPESLQGAPEFRAEVENLSKLHHNHLVHLFGYCEYKNEMLLVYEFIHNGTLDDHLHTLGSPLSWLQRLRICIGVARALDISWEAKISDFGISKRVPEDQNLTDDVHTAVKGTYGYADPSYTATGKVTRKSDVYSFGVVLLEVLCRKRPTATSFNDEYRNIVRWAQDSIKDGRLKRIIDSDIRDEIYTYTDSLKEFVQIVGRCLDNDPENRPTMAEVVSTIEYIFNLQEKTDDLLQPVRRRVFGTQSNTFSGMEFEMRIPKKNKLLMLREKILQQNGMLSSKRVLIRIFQLKLNSFGSIKIFGAKELEKATNGYAEDMILGKGAQGIVFKGILPDKRVVAIKIIRILSQSRLEQFITEIAILEQISHKNVVQLLGCCFKTESAMLVYEYVSNGTLHRLIHSELSGVVRLSWDSRLRIAHESADALSYLHTYERVSIIHRDVKSANILLDENYTVKISDFGSSRLIPLNRGQVHAEVEGTLGYLDPEYYNTCQLTCKADVYGFGVVLAELLTGKKPIDRKRDDDIRLSTYFVKETKENRLRETVDPQVLEEANEEQLSAACDLVYRCLEPIGGNRPSMKEVTVELATLRKLGEARHNEAQ